MRGHGPFHVRAVSWRARRVRTLKPGMEIGALPVVQRTRLFFGKSNGESNH